MKALVWVPRILSGAILVFFLIFLQGEGPPRPGTLVVIEKLMFASIGIAFAGLLLGWRYPGVGGVVALAGYSMFGCFTGPRVLLSPFALIAIAALLYLASWWSAGHSHARQLGLALAAFCLVGIAGWLALGASARGLEARAVQLPDVTGHWSGTAYLTDSRVTREPLSINVRVLPDGGFEGSFGAAAITGGHIESRLKGRLGYLQHRLGEPAYCMALELSGPPIAGPRRSLPQARICFEIHEGEMAAAVHTPDLPEDLRDLRAVLRPL